MSVFRCLRSRMEGINQDIIQPEKSCYPRCFLERRLRMPTVQYASSQKCPTRNSWRNEKWNVDCKANDDASRRIRSLAKMYKPIESLAKLYKPIRSLAKMYKTWLISRNLPTRVRWHWLQERPSLEEARTTNQDVPRTDVFFAAELNGSDIARARADVGTCAYKVDHDACRANAPLSLVGITEIKSSGHTYKTYAFFLKQLY